MLYIIDRRFESRNKSSVNRNRFLRRFGYQVRKAVAEAIDRTGIRDLEEGRRIGIPARDLSEPCFRHGKGGLRQHVHAGNDRFRAGDEIERPPGGLSPGREGQASPEGGGLDSFAFTLSREEFLDFFFDELALPNLVKRDLACSREPRWVRAGYSQTGIPANLHYLRTLRGAASRRIAFGAQDAQRLEEVESRLAETPAGDEGEPALLLERARLKERLRSIPFIEDSDLRFRHRVRVLQPSTRAVIFCLMDVSGSMDQEKKNMAKRFFSLLYLFLKRTYEQIDLVFIRHHTVAEEVDEEGFFHSRETGGTVVSSALKLMRRLVEERYAGGAWNIYGAQASDGDNWQEDSSACMRFLNEHLLPLTQFFAYVEIASDHPQSLWLEYEKAMRVHPGNFAMKRIRSPRDIYPVFQELFRRREAGRPS